MEVKLPSLGESASTGTVVKILVKEGDSVEKDQALMEIESDKAVAELPAPEAGTVDSILASENDEVSEGDVLAILSEGEAGEAKEEKAETKDQEQDQDQEREDRENDGNEAGADTGRDEAAGEPRKAETEPDQEPEAKRGQRAPAAPSIRRMAAELGIDLDRVGGSGRGGRIEIEDLRAYIAQLEKRVERGAKEDQKEATDLPEMPDAADYGEVETESLAGIRRTIARRLARTWPNVPQVTQFGEADLSELMRLKEEHGDAFEQEDAKLTLTAILVAMLPKLLAEYPYFNASLDLENETVIVKKYHHIGLAVDTGKGLVVPVLRDVGEKHLLEIARGIAELAESARAGKLDRKAMEGGSFTLSNQGGLGGGAFTPLVRYPESAILGVGRAAERLVKVEDSIEAHPFLPLALSYDHRLIDGADAARFMADLVEALENPDASLFEL